MKIIDTNVNLSNLFFKNLPDFLSDVYVKGYFSCSNNQLTSLEGSPKEVGGDFFCKNNKIKFTEEDVRKVCKVKGRIYTGF
jgi:hypothetical protein